MLFLKTDINKHEMPIPYPTYFTLLKSKNRISVNLKFGITFDSKFVLYLNGKNRRDYIK